MSEQRASDKLNTSISRTPAACSARSSDNPKVKLKKNQLKDIAFFKSFGTNGRACLHCHTPGDAWTVSAASVAYPSHPLDATNADCIVSLASCPAEPNAANYGLDPIFRTIDGSNSPHADVSTRRRRAAGRLQHAAARRA